MVSDKDGKIVLADETLSVMAVGELPMMKDRWFTASTILGECFVIGDRCGGVHFMARSGDSLVMRMSYPRLHGRHGVTQLLVDGGVVWSSGRDGQVRGYTLSEKGARLVQTVRIQRPAVHLSGQYTCKVASFFKEEKTRHEVIIFGESLPLPLD